MTQTTIHIATLGLEMITLISLKHYDSFKLVMKPKLYNGMI